MISQGLRPRMSRREFAKWIAKAGTLAILPSVADAFMPGMMWVVAQANNVPKPNVLWWPFTDGSGNTLTASVGPNGTLANPSWSAGPGGGTGRAVTFNGTSSTLQSASSVSVGNNQCSLCAWIYQDTFNASGGKAWFEGNANYNNTPFPTCSVFPNEASSRIQTGICSATGSYRVQSFSQPSAAAWHHYVFYFDNSSATGNIRLWIDAVEQTSQATLNNNKTGTSNFSSAINYLMARGAASVFDAGRLSGIRVYSRLLTNGEITAIKNADFI